MMLIISVYATLAMILAFVVIRRTEKELALLKILGNVNSRATRITLAIDRLGKDAGTGFIPVSLWAPLAENVSKYLSEGRQVAVEGRLQTGSYTDQSGKTVYTLSVAND